MFDGIYSMLLSNEIAGMLLNGALAWLSVDIPEALGSQQCT
jgi:hypothetical protein